MSDQEYPDFSEGYGETYTAEAEYLPVPTPPPRAVTGELMPLERNIEALTMLREQHREENFVDRFLNHHQHQREIRAIKKEVARGLRDTVAIATGARVEATKARAKSQLAQLREQLNAEGMEIKHEYQLRAVLQVSQTIEKLKSDPRLPDWLKERQIKVVIEDFKQRYPE